MKRSRGLSLIEVLVTITITSIGLMGLVSLQMQSVRATSDSGNRSQAIWVLNDMINRIQANEASSKSYLPNPDDGSPISCDGYSGPICSSYHNGNVPKSPANCTGDQLAKWDMYEVACPLNATGYIGDSIAYLPEAKITITCNSPSPPCQNGDSLNVKLEWRARTDDESITGAKRKSDGSSGLLTIDNNT